MNSKKFHSGSVVHVTRMLQGFAYRCDEMRLLCVDLTQLLPHLQQHE